MKGEMSRMGRERREGRREANREKGSDVGKTIKVRRVKYVQEGTEEM